MLCEVQSMPGPRKRLDGRKNMTKYLGTGFSLRANRFGLRVLE